MNHYIIHVHREVDDEGAVFWVAAHTALEGCMAQGKTPDEAVENLDEARHMVLRHLKEHDLPIPAGDTSMPCCLVYVH